MSKKRKAALRKNLAVACLVTLFAASLIFNISTTPVSISVSTAEVIEDCARLPVPEFPTTLVVLASALAAALSILRRRKK